MFSNPLQVKPSSAVDPCSTPIEQVSNTLKSFVIGEGNKLDGFLRKGEINQAAQLAQTVLKSANEETECGKTMSLAVKTLVRGTDYCILMVIKFLLEVNGRKLLFWFDPEG